MTVAHSHPCLLPHTFSLYSLMLIFWPLYIFKKIYSFLFFGCGGSLLLHTVFLQLLQAGITLCCGVQVSHCSGFSCFSACALGSWTSVVVVYMLCCMCNLPGPGIEPVPLVMRGGFLITGPQGSPSSCTFKCRPVFEAKTLYKYLNWNVHEQKYFL